MMAVQMIRFLCFLFDLHGSSGVSGATILKILLFPLEHG
jgi:hypothetical protein